MSRRERAYFGLAGRAGSPDDCNIPVRHAVVVATRSSEPAYMPLRRSGPRQKPTFNPNGRYAEPRGLRLSEPGQLLARGPLDYDVPVLRRCVDCRGIWPTPLGDAASCPHCQRTLDLGGAA